MERFDVLIVGGGVAGLATACQLTNRGMKDVVLLEREEYRGFYASGHNAGVGRQLTGLKEHTALTIQGRGLLADVGLIDDSGGLLLGAEPGGTARLADEAAHFRLKVQQGAGAMVEGLLAAEYLRIPSDGIIDVDGMLRYCAEEARYRGASLRFGCALEAIHVEDDGFRVEADGSVLHARFLVNAAGAWAQALGRMAGGLDIPFTPLRRHLVWSRGPHPQNQPWTWWADRPLYLRPESGGLLMCACEEQPVPLPERGCQPPCDETPVLESLSASLQEVAPAVADLPITRIWCGLRTFAPDRRFVLGRDPRNPRLFWAAGLGGHGMTSGLAVGDLTAATVLDAGDPGPLSPARLQKG